MFLQVESFALRYKVQNPPAYSPLMDTIAATRRANLLLLLEEVGLGRGDAAKLSRLTGVKPPIISQLRKRTYYPNGVERTMGDDIARKLEAGMGKQTGWMDHPHTITRDIDELELLQVIRRLTPEQREHITSAAKLFSRTNTPSAEGSDTMSHERPPKH